MQIAQQEKDGFQSNGQNSQIIQGKYLGHLGRDILQGQLYLGIASDQTYLDDSITNTNLGTGFS